MKHNSKHFAVFRSSTFTLSTILYERDGSKTSSRICWDGERNFSMIFYFLFRGWKTFEFLKFILKLKLQGLDTEIQFFFLKKMIKLLIVILQNFIKIWKSFCPLIFSKTGTKFFHPLTFDDFNVGEKPRSQKRIKHVCAQLKYRWCVMEYTLCSM
jgi:hypothetical protein